MNTNLLVSTLLFVLVIVAALGVTATPATASSDVDEEVNTIVRTPDGGYLLVGYIGSYDTGSRDMWLVKVDSKGNELWNETYGGDENDEGISAVRASDGGYVIAGYKSSEMWLLKIDSKGNVTWERTYGGARKDSAYSVVQTADGGYALAGGTNSFGDGGDMWLIKVDSEGNKQWSRNYGGDGFEIATSLVQTVDGGYVLAGTTDSYGSGETDIWLVKVDSRGDKQWSRAYGGTGVDDNGNIKSIIQTMEGGYVVAGNTYSYGNGSGDMWLVKTESEGDKQWSKTYGGSEKEVTISIIKTSDGGYAIAGGTNSYGNGGDMWLVKTDPEGNKQWSKTYGGGEVEIANSLVQTDGGYLLGGGTNTYSSGETDMWLVKIDSEGNEEWNRSYSGNKPSEDNNMPGFGILMAVVSILVGSLLLRKHV